LQRSAQRRASHKAPRKKTHHEEICMTQALRRTRLAAAIGTVSLALGAGYAHGAGFALQENSGSGMGNAFAGGAASAEDASTVWANPAGMSRLASPEAALAIHIITPSFKFKDNGSVAAAFQPLGGDGGDAGKTVFVPNLYITYPVNRQITLGLGVNAPFGLVTEYDGDWIGRFQAIKSDIKTINVNPAVSWRVTDTFTVGLGVDWQRIDSEFTQSVNYSAGIAQAAQTAAQGGVIPPGLVPTIVGATGGLSSFSRIKGDDDAWGWNIGFLWDVSPQTRFGMHYRSSVKYKIDANASFDLPTLPTLPPALGLVVGQLAGAVNAQLQNGGVTSDVKLPDIVNASLFTRLNDRWDLMGDVQFTRWSTIKDLTFVRTTGAVLSSTPENFDDSWRVAVGANYRYTDAWMFRGGLAWDQSPVNTTDRTPRLPDEDRFWLSLGAQYKFNRNLKVDGGFSYLWLQQPDINQNAGNTARSGLIKGHYDANVTLFSAQLTYTF
jgi:long-chain fatty acid transport protein